MKIVFFGNGVRALACLDRLFEEKMDVCALVLHEKKDVALDVRFATLGEIYNPKNPNSKEFVKTIQSLEPDLIILSGYNKIVKKDLINIPKLGMINLHGGKLPEYRGTAPINWQIINGEIVGGCCVLYVDEGIDTGNILVQEFFRISEHDIAQDVVNKQLSLFPDMLVRAIKLVEDGYDGYIQDEYEAHYYTRRYPDDSQIQWSIMSGDDVHNLIRAMHGDYPTAFCYLDDLLIKIWHSSSYREKITGTPGRVIKFIKGKALVTCKTGAVLIGGSVVDGDWKGIRNVLKIGDKLS